jgi:hypothetical protein
MNNLAKVEEEQHKNRYYLMQSNKSTRKSDGEFSIIPRATRKHYDEEIIDRDGPLSFTNLKPSMRSIFKNAADRFPTGINIIGFSQENFKRFYKLPKVRQLTDCLYNVALEI